MWNISCHNLREHLRNGPTQILKGRWWEQVDAAGVHTRRFIYWAPAFSAVSHQTGENAQKGKQSPRCSYIKIHQI